MRSRADDQETILEMSWCKMVVLLKHGDRTHGQEELLPPTCEAWLIIPLEVERGTL